MTLDEIYQRAKAAFDAKIAGIAELVNGKTVLTTLKSRERALNKIHHEHFGDATKIRDILRATIVVDSVDKVNDAYQRTFENFLVTSSRNGYLAKVHSSDGYFDAKIDVDFMGVNAEIQIHTQAMLDAKEKAHGLFRKRQAIQRAVPKGYRPSSEQARKINELNKQMRELFREAVNTG